jgi:hypothetical protein
MENRKIVNKLAVVGALIVILGVGSAASEAFARPADARLNSEVSTQFNG